MILVDTSVLIDFFRGKKNAATRRFRTVLEQNLPFGITSFIFQEVLQGAKTEREYGRLRKYLSTQRFYHPNSPLNSFEAAARLYFECRKKGITIRSTIDCLVAQITIENNLALLHNDRDFEAMSAVVPLKFWSLE
jgi:predicted nucleic acid-binding protein